MSKYLKYLSRFSRRTKIILQLMADAAFIMASFLTAMLLRLESAAFMGKSAGWAALLIAVTATLVAFTFMGVYRVLVRYITNEILVSVGKGALIAAATLYATGIFLNASIPWSVSIIFALLVFLSLSGLRFTARTLFRNPTQIYKRPVIIYGAGEAGRQLVNSLFHGQEYLPVALIDDDPKLQQLIVGGLTVSKPDRISQIARETGAYAVLLAIPSMGNSQRQKIVRALEIQKLEIKTVPSISDIINGKAKISELRTVSAEDLLGRDPVAPNRELLKKNITGRVVMVSGAGGSIGSELSRQILHLLPSTLVLYEMSEIALYKIEEELSEITKRLKYKTKVFSVLGSVQHNSRLEATITTFKVRTVYHTAAYKHVPLVEENVVEGVLNNVFGTLAITLAAKKLGVENFILISTDKAVRPANVMGATKRVAELVCQAHAHEASKTVFSIVRFGNVLGSSGSVIPQFQSQIDRGGPVTVTHKDIIRYFMTVTEAAELVLQAGALGKGGDVFVLDMGEPVKIMDLALEMVKLHGLTPYMVDHPDEILPEEGDIPICVTGLRKGEKLYEELLIGNNPSPTQHPRIMTASENSLPMEELIAFLNRLRQACEIIDVSSIMAILHELPLEFTPLTEETSDLLLGEQLGK